MSYLRFLREYLSNIPNSVQDGSIYFKKSDRALSIDLDKRYRLNPPSDWNETNIEDPAYIANKPVLGTVASYDVATSLTDYDSIPTIQLLNDELELRRLQFASMLGRPQVASSLDEMTDITKVYVYDGYNDQENDLQYGYWYYFDTALTAWKKGTEYGGFLSISTMTDNTLSLRNVPADAKATGDKFAEILELIGGLYEAISVFNEELGKIHEDIQLIKDNMPEIPDNPDEPSESGIIASYTDELLTLTAFGNSSITFEGETLIITDDNISYDSGSETLQI